MKLSRIRGTTRAHSGVECSFVDWETGILIKGAFIVVRKGKPTQINLETVTNSDDLNRQYSTEVSPRIAFSGK